MKNEFDYLNDVKMDFSIYDEDIISEKEIRTMKQKKNMKKIFVIAACVAVVAVSCTAFASGFVSNIVKTISTGYNTVYQTDPSLPHELPAELKGKLFDENGVQLDAISDKDLESLYDENGNHLDQKALAQIYTDALAGDENIKVELAEYDGGYDPEESEKSYASIEEAQKDAAFDIKVPEYIPEGYSLTRAYAYKDENGTIEPESSLYMTLEYTNGKKKMFIFERLLNEETAFETGTDGKIEETTINGCKAVIMDESSIMWETKDNVSVDIAGKGYINKAELVKIAKSVK